MNLRSLISSAVIILILIVQVIGGPGCANIVPPAGGPRDSIPPQLTGANPSDSSRNFTGSRIVFSFDEYVEIQSVTENLIVSPVPRVFPQVDHRLNTITLRLRDTLERNTTYSLNFGDAIKDINEGNIMKGFTYTFSTGPYIDSLELRGRVILAQSGRIDTTLTVMLHTSPEDSAVIKQKPRYMAKLDSRGYFHFKNLPPATFYVYALKDETGALRYLDDRKLFAFADGPVTMNAKTDTITLYAYSVEPTVQSAPLPGLPSGVRIKGRDNTQDKRLRFVTNLSNDMQDLLSELIISFDFPLKNYDSAKLSLSTDSTYLPVAAYKIIKDSSNRKLQLVTSWKENTRYNLIIDKDFAEDSTGRKLLKTDTLNFRTKKLADYASLQLKLRNLDFSKNPVLLFFANNLLYKSYPLAGSDFSQALFLPGEYELRILYDENRNGRWDPGDFFGKRKQPELIRPVQRRITVRAGVENEFEIAL